MADISQITLPSGDTYNIKDTVARAGVSSGGTFVIAWAGNAAPTVANIPKGVVVKYNNTEYTGTKTASVDDLKKFFLVAATSQGDNQETLDIYDEYVVIDNGASANPRYSWEKIGDTQVKLTAMVTNVTLNKQTTNFVTSYSNPGKADVIGASSTMTLTAPTYSVTPSTTYIKASASGGSVSWNAKDQKSAITSLGTPDTGTFLKKVTTASKKLSTTAITGVQSSTTTASKATAGTTQTTATGAGTTSSTNTDWLKGVSVSGEVLSIGAATLNTQNTTQFTFSDVTVPIKNSTSTTVANGNLSETSVTSNVGATIITGVTSSGEGYTGSAITEITPTSANVIGASSTFTVNQPTIALATDSATATGRVQVALGTKTNATLETNGSVAWNSKDQKSALTSLGTQNTAAGLNNSTTITVSRPS